MITLVSFTFLHLNLYLSVSLEMYPETIPLLKLWVIATIGKLIKTNLDKRTLKVRIDCNTKAVVKQFGPYM